MSLSEKDFERLNAGEIVSIGPPEGSPFDAENNFGHTERVVSQYKKINGVVYKRDRTDLYWHYNKSVTSSYTEWSVVVGLSPILLFLAAIIQTMNFSQSKFAQ